MTLFYDPMIAKLVTWGEDRDAALRHMKQALADSEVLGPASNLDFLSRLLALPVVRDGRLHSNSLAETGESLTAEAETVSDEALALAVGAQILEAREDAARAAAGTRDPHSPWALLPARRWAWRVAGVAEETVTFLHNEQPITLGLEQSGGLEPGGAGFWLTLPSGRYLMTDLTRQGSKVSLVFDGCRILGRVLAHGDGLLVSQGGRRSHLRRKDPLAVAGGGGSGSGRILAPMPGRVIAGGGQQG